MKFNAIREAIAKSLAWTRIEEWDGNLFGCVPGTDNPAYKYALPDYPNDLNACAEFEKTLDDGDPPDACETDRYEIVLSEIAYRPCMATPLQRCEAFLRVKGLWKEEK